MINCFLVLQVDTFSLKMKTNQYSVTQRARKIEPGRGSHGVSGIFFKYDLHPICVNVMEKHREFSQVRTSIQPISSLLICMGYFLKKSNFTKHFNKS